MNDEGIIETVDFSEFETLFQVRRLKTKDGKLKSEKPAKPKHLELLDTRRARAVGKYLYVCVCVYICVCMYVCVYVYVCVCMCVCMCMCTCLYVCMYVYMCLYVCICMCTCVCMCVYVCVCVFVCVYTYVCVLYMGVMSCNLFSNNFSVCQAKD